MKSTYVSWQREMVTMGMLPEMWRFDGKYNFIEFINGSRIDFLDVAYQPSDPMYQRLGSLEYTGGWIEEAGEVNQGAFDMLKTRIGRFSNDVYGLFPAKILLTCNPDSGWLYRLFYKPWKEKKLDEDYQFVQAFPQDNPNVKMREEYIATLNSISDPVMKERMLFGNWEYESDDTMIFTYDSIIDMFTNNVPESPHWYITADIARFGSDATVFILWKGLRAMEVIVKNKLGTDESAEFIRALAAKHRVPYSHIIVDEDGIGGGTKDQLRGIKGFQANSPAYATPGKRENYANLKTQCAYVLADYVNQHNISLSGVTDEDLKNRIIEEFHQCRRRDPDSEGRLKIRPKDEVKSIIGRSPDVFDAVLFRIYFELRTPESRKSFDSSLSGSQIADISSIY